jgi:site-specific recombinase XerD
LTVQAFNEKLGGGRERSRSLVEIFKEHNYQVEKLLHTDFSPGTLERYKTALKHVQSFMKWKFNVDDIDINKLSYQFVTDYEFWLKAELKCSHNTAVKYIGNLKKIINICIKNGWLDRDPFFGWKMNKREVVREYLSEDEIEKVYHHEFGTSRLTLVRDIFIFSCYTGLAYADIEKLKRSEIIIGIDGEKWISIQRQKTETPSRIPLLSIPLEILDRYKGDIRCSNKDQLLPIFSNQKMNEYLKEIAQVCGIEKEFTFHCARHTFATTVTLSNGVPIESVSKMLGHRNIKTTQHYAKILDNKVSYDMKLLRKKLNSKKAKDTKMKINKKTGSD